MQTTMIRASITAYSTAVGPSSRFRKFTTFCFRFFSMTHILSLSPHKRTDEETKHPISHPPASAPSTTHDVAEGFLGGLTPFGSLAIRGGPMALRPTLAGGLPLSRNPAV